MAFEALLAARGRVRIQLGGRASGMRQKDTGTPKEDAPCGGPDGGLGGDGSCHRGGRFWHHSPAGVPACGSDGGAVGSAVGRARPMRPTAPKRKRRKNNTETPKNDSASSEAESTAASAAQPSAPQPERERRARCIGGSGCTRRGDCRRACSPRKQLLLPP